MNKKMLVKVMHPVDALISRPIPIVKRCNTCAHEGKCDLLNQEASKVRHFFKRVVENDCPCYTPQVIVVANDATEIVNLKRFSPTRVE